MGIYSDCPVVTAEQVSHPHLLPYTGLCAQLHKVNTRARTDTPAPSFTCHFIIRALLLLSANVILNFSEVVLFCRSLVFESKNLTAHMRSRSPRTWTTLCQKFRKWSKTFLACSCEGPCRNSNLGCGRGRTGTQQHPSYAAAWSRVALAVQSKTWRRCWAQTGSSRSWGSVS